ncbi:translation elongation factor Ts [Thiobacter aerophilum]|uniref:Elongation factor Ts n=1 Tax=Thiobacter aerophilum TaxID=3121275 RepID=A0ABV0EAZ1_9BURK
MAEITASMVKELRERTGLGMMECKKALTEANGDMNKAEDLLRIKSGAKASKAAGRIAAEGVIGSYVSPDGKIGALVEVNCETDFVAKNEEFLNFAKACAQLVAEHDPADVEALSKLKMASGQTVEEARQALIMKLGENMAIRRIARFATSGRLSVYLHGNRIGVMVDLNGGDETLGKDIAMHVAASKPIAVSKEQVPAETIEREREIAKARALESGKPANIVDKIVEGSVAKFLAEVTLLGQPFVKNPDQSVEALLKSKGATVNSFTLFIVGEGIEKKVVDYAAEVAAAAKV